MGVKGNPTIAELMCYFCNLSLDLQTSAPEPRNHQKGKTGAALLCCHKKADQLLWIQCVCLRRFYRDVSTFSGKNKNRSTIIKESLFGWKKTI